MSDLRHQSDEELLRRLKADQRSKRDLLLEVQQLEHQLGAARSRLHNLGVRMRWTAHYLAGGTASEME